MKKLFLSFLLGIGLSSFAQHNNALQSLSQNIHYNSKNKAVLIELRPAAGVPENQGPALLKGQFLKGEDWELLSFKNEVDELGFSHRRYKVLYKGTEVYQKVIISHSRNGQLQSLNGDLELPSQLLNSVSISGTEALAFALNKVKAKKYMWENQAEEENMRRLLNNPNFSYRPVAKKVLVERGEGLRYAYHFLIYAESPLYRANILVDAQNGSILEEENLICSVDVPGSAQTKYSGTQSITCDQSGTVFSLRETQRGNGIETYNLNNGTNYGAATNFTNASATWTGGGFDQGARDAHWGAEKTYDYFFNQHGRNSIDGNGFKLLSYVHYNSNYSNAFWDGARMTYGDGNGTSMYIFTTLDICGHEITHGLTENSANLNYQGESGALNESYSDIFGTLIENYGRPGNWNWKVGEDMTANGNGIRNMQNPAPFSDPDTYGGQYWYTGTADNGGVHTNSGVSNFWFYLLSMGGSGTNDLSQAYSVSALGLNHAAQIAYRALTQYFTPTTNYANARLLTIQAAKDLFGTCSNQVIQTTNAWHAVGVGAAYIPGLIGANFVANKTNHCSLPATVNFNNTTTNGITYSWDFGDGSALSSGTNVVHTYTSNGSFTVKLKASGCNNGSDSTIKVSYIMVNSPAAPVATNGSACENSSATLTASGSNPVSWYAGSNSTVPLFTGNSFATPVLTANATYYAACTISNSPVFGGIPSHVGGGFLNNASQWLIFDVTSNCTLNSVLVNAQNAGNRVIELRNSSSQPLYSFTAALTAGINTVNLNFYLTPGSSYQLGLANGSASSLYRSNSGVSYPYNVGGIVNITGSSAGAAFYYWFYNWKVTEADCMSPMVPVTASVLPNPQVQIGTSSTLVCMNDEVQLSGSPSGGTFSGNGVNGSSFVSPTSTGNYAIAYTYTDANGCSGSDSLMLQVSECVGLSEHAENSSVMLYPNPVNEVLILSVNSKETHQFEIYDSSGRLVMKDVLRSERENLNVSQFSKGLYLLRLLNTNGETEAEFKVLKN